MNPLKKKIEQCGVLLGGDVLKVDSFLNHQLDIPLIETIGECLANHFKNAGITKVVTIETGGIAPAYAAARRLGVPVIFLKKSEPRTMRQPLCVQVFSFTKQKSYNVCMESGLIEPDERVLFIDDFLANGEAFKGAESLIHQAGAHIAGVGICIEKRFQAGHQYVVGRGYDFCAVASIAAIENGTIHWAQ